MSGLTGFLVMLCLLQYSDAISAWEATGFNIPTNGANAAMTLTAKVPESKMAGETMFTIAATKEQSANTLTYTKVSGDIATVASGTGVVTVATGKSLDFETTPSYVILIKAEESGGAAAGTATVTVSIQNVLEFAKTQYEVCVADATAAGTVIGTYTVVDAVSGTDTVTYSNAPATDLIVDAATGVLKVATGKTLTSATTGGYITIITADQTGTNAAASADGTTEVKVTVGGCSGTGASVTGWTEAPFTLTNGQGTATITGSVTNKVAENIVPGDTLFSAVAAGAISYTITSGNTGSVMQISAAGVVTLAAGKSLDFETTPSYTLVITATGASGSPGVANLTVNIKNVLEFGKTQYDVCMADGSTADTTVGTYTVKDNTGGATVTYAITSGNTNSDFTFTAAGELKVSTGKTLAQKTTEQYTVVLAATESGSPAVADLGSTTVSITVGTCGCSAVAATLGLTLLAVVVAVSA